MKSTDREYIEQRRCLKESLIVQHKPEILNEMQEIAKAHGVHPALIALKWAHQRGEISIPFSVHNYVSNLKCVTEDP